MDAHLLVLSPSDASIIDVKPETGQATAWLTDVDDVPDGIVVDGRYGRVFWTNMGRPDDGGGPDRSFFARNGSIERANIDGTGRTTVVARGSFATGKQLAADFVGGRLYWCDREGMAVFSAELNGADCRALYRTVDRNAADAANHCVGVAVDPIHGRLYWTQKGAPNAGQGQILTAPLESPDGQDPAARPDVETLWSGLPEPVNLDIDLDGNLLWTDRGDAPTGNTLNRADPNRPGERPEIISSGYRQAIGLAVSDGVAYVSDLSGVIRRVDSHNGTDKEVVNLGRPLADMAIINI